MAEALHLLAAGSLSQALAGLGPVSGRPVACRFGPSGLLRAQIEAGAKWDVFVSADQDQPTRLHKLGLGQVPRILCHNTMALILRPDLAGRDVLGLLRDGRLRLGISTPGNDPSGNYAVAVLNRLDPAIAPRALRLTSAPDLPPAPKGRNTYAWMLASGAADLFLTYRCNAITPLADTPALRALDLPEHCQIRATYALTLRQGAGPEAVGLRDLILGPAIQSRLATCGFTPLFQITTTGALA
jgi:ABC-type molybdate transport system substrate-binding protein